MVLGYIVVRRSAIGCRGPVGMRKKNIKESGIDNIKLKTKEIQPLTEHRGIEILWKLVRNKWEKENSLLFYWNKL